MHGSTLKSFLNMNPYLTNETPLTLVITLGVNRAVFAAVSAHNWAVMSHRTI